MTKATTLDFDSDLAPLLRRVENGARYAGGEYGQVRKPDADYRVAVAFPDLYEIGMANSGTKVLYSILNQLVGVGCERVYAPDHDFADLLKAKGFPLPSLETYRPIGSFDLVGFSIGYELAATNVLYMLDLAHIPRRSSQRASGDPIVLAGGPAITNPEPFLPFFDGVFIGEAEGVLPDLVTRLRMMKRGGAAREDALGVLGAHPSIYSAQKPQARRAIWMGFGDATSAPFYPVPNLRTVQDHGVTEIMRGCPNGCRFCHAGYFYRPFRMKPRENVVREIRDLVHVCGYDEATLSSLSSGDYDRIEVLLRQAAESLGGIPLQLSVPSLRVESVGLPLIEALSVGRAGLTFAIETASEAGRIAINKPISAETVWGHLEEAKRHGWRSAKFYFMIGLPDADVDEVEAIASFLSETYYRSRLELHVNVATFVPKPHTPFQWAGQLPGAEAEARLHRLIRLLPSRKIRVSYPDPLLSEIEAIIARSDRTVADAIESAYERGCTFDAWEDRIRSEIWRDTIHRGSPALSERFGRALPYEEPLPWDGVDLGVRPSYLRAQAEAAHNRQMTDPCAERCPGYCGVCGAGIHPKPESGEHLPESGIKSDESAVDAHRADLAAPEGESTRILVALRRTGPAAFLPHLSLVSVVYRACRRAGVSVALTRGFRPKPRIEIAQPCPVGMTTESDMISLDVCDRIHPESLCRRVSAVLPEGLSFVTAWIPRSAEGRRSSLMSAYWGGEYLMSVSDPAVASTIVGLCRDRGDEVEPADAERIRSEGVLEHLGASGGAARLAYLVRSPDGDGSRKALFRYLRESLGSAGDGASGLLVTRLRQLARPAAGACGGQPYRDYREAFPPSETTNSSDASASLASSHAASSTSSG